MLRPGQSRPSYRLTGLSQRLAAGFSPNVRCHLQSALVLALVWTFTD